MEALIQLFQNNLNIYIKIILKKLIYNSNSFASFNRDYNSIIEDTDIVHIFGIWRPFHIRAYLASKNLKKL